MFELKGHRTTNEAIYRIADSRFVLFSDGDNDMLYTGRNQYGNRVLGTIVAEDDEESLVRYLHVIVTNEQYRDFLKRRVSLMKLLQGQDGFFVVDVNHNGQVVDSASTSLNDIPSAYRPNQNSYCPDFVSDPFLDYDIEEGKQF